MLPNKKTFSIVICTGDNADLPEGRGCLRTFFEKIYESMMRVDLLAVVFHAVNLRPCGSIRDVPLAMCSLRDGLWPYAHHAMSSGYVVQGVLRIRLCVLHAIVKAICSPGVGPLVMCSPDVAPLAVCSPGDELWPYGSRRDCQNHMLTGNECRGNSTRTSKCHEEHISKAAASQISPFVFSGISHIMRGICTKI